MKLKEFRKKYNLTQNDIAQAVGCTRQNICYFEVADLEPTVDLAKKIGNAYGVDWTIFFEDERKLNLQANKMRG